MELSKEQVGSGGIRISPLWSLPGNYSGVLKFGKEGGSSVNLWRLWGILESPFPTSYGGKKSPGSNPVGGLHKPGNFTNGVSRVRGLGKRDSAEPAHKVLGGFPKRKFGVPGGYIHNAISKGLRVEEHTGAFGKSGGC